MCCCCEVFFFLVIELAEYALIGLFNIKGSGGGKESGFEVET